MALWCRTRVCVGQSEAKTPVYDINHEALRSYLDAGGPLVDDWEEHEILDGLMLVRSLMQG